MSSTPFPPPEPSGPTSPTGASPHGQPGPHEGPGQYGAPGPFGAPGQHGAPGGPGEPGQGGRPTETLAVLGLVFAFVVWPVGLVLSILGLRRTRARGTGGRGLALAGVIVSSVVGALTIASVVALVVALAGAGTAAREAGRSVPSVPSVPAPTSPDASRTSGAAGVLPLKTPTTLGAYQVAVTGVNPDADQVVAQSNQYNEPAKGTYVIVDLAVTYQGDEQGQPWIDLPVSYQGSDARVYSTSTCSATIPQQGFDQPKLLKGGQVAYSVCFDLPPAAVPGGQVAVAPLLDLGGASATWKP